VRDGAVEAAQPVLALARALVRQAQEVGGGVLLDHGDGAEDAVPAHQQLAAAARLVHVVRRVHQEVEEHAAQDLVLAQDLVRVEALGVPQLAQLHRLGHDRRVGRDLVRRVLQVARDPVDEERHVVQQLVRGKMSFGLEGDALGDAAEPPFHQPLAPLAHALREGAARGHSRVALIGWVRVPVTCERNRMGKLHSARSHFRRTPPPGYLRGAPFASGTRGPFQGGWIERDRGGARPARAAGDAV
jgi:hypothetical protein